MRSDRDLTELKGLIEQFINDNADFTKQVNEYRALYTPSTSERLFGWMSPSQSSKAAQTTTTPLITSATPEKETTAKLDNWHTPTFDAQLKAAVSASKNFLSALAAKDKAHVHIDDSLKHLIAVYPTLIKTRDELMALNKKISEDTVRFSKKGKIFLEKKATETNPLILKLTNNIISRDEIYKLPSITVNADDLHAQLLKPLMPQSEPKPKANKLAEEQTAARLHEPLEQLTSIATELKDLKHKYQSTDWQAMSNTVSDIQKRIAKQTITFDSLALNQSLNKLVSPFKNTALSETDRKSQQEAIEAEFDNVLNDLAQQTASIEANIEAISAVARQIPNVPAPTNVDLEKYEDFDTLYQQYNKRIHGLTQHIGAIAHHNSCEQVMLLIDRFRQLVRQKTFMNICEEADVYIPDIDLYFLIPQHQKFFSKKIHADILTKISEFNLLMNTKEKLLWLKKIMKENHTTDEYFKIYGALCESFGGEKARKVLDGCVNFLKEIREDYKLAREKSDLTNTELYALLDEIEAIDEFEQADDLLAQPLTSDVRKVYSDNKPRVRHAIQFDRWSLQQELSNQTKESADVITQAKNTFQLLNKNVVELSNTLNVLKSNNLLASANHSTRYDLIITKRNTIINGSQQISAYIQELLKPENIKTKQLKKSSEPTAGELTQKLDLVEKKQATTTPKLVAEVNLLAQELYQLKRKTYGIWTHIHNHYQDEDFTFGLYHEPDPFNCDLSFGSIYGWLKDDVTQLETWFATFQQLEEKSKKLVNHANDRAESLRPNGETLRQLVELRETISADTAELETLRVKHDKKSTELLALLNAIYNGYLIGQQSIAKNWLSSELLEIKKNMLTCLNGLNSKNPVSVAATQRRLDEILSLDGYYWQALDFEYTRQPKLSDIFVFRDVEDLKKLIEVADKFRTEFGFELAFYDSLPSAQPTTTQDNEIRDLSYNMFQVIKTFINADKRKIAINESIDSLANNLKCDLTTLFAGRLGPIENSLDKARTTDDELSARTTELLKTFVNFQNDKERVDELISSCKERINLPNTPKKHRHYELSSSCFSLPLRRNYFAEKKAVYERKISRLEACLKNSSLADIHVSQQHEWLKTITDCMLSGLDYTTPLALIKNKLITKRLYLTTIQTVNAEDKISFDEKFISNPESYASSIASLTDSRARLIANYTASETQIKHLLSEIIHPEVLKKITEDVDDDESMQLLTRAASHIKDSQKLIIEADSLYQTKYSVALDAEVIDKLSNFILATSDELSSSSSVIKTRFENALKQHLKKPNEKIDVNTLCHRFNLIEINLKNIGTDVFLTLDLQEAFNALKNQLNTVKKIYVDPNYFETCLNNLFNIQPHIYAQKHGLWTFYQEKMKKVEYLFTSLAERYDNCQMLRMPEGLKMQFYYWYWLRALRNWSEQEADVFLSDLQDLSKGAENIKKHDETIALLIDEEKQLHEVNTLRNSCDQHEKALAEHADTLQTQLDSINLDIEFIESLEKRVAEKSADLKKLDEEQQAIRLASDALTTGQVNASITGVIFKRFKRAFFNQPDVKEIIEKLEQRAAQYTDHKKKPNNKEAILDFIKQLNECTNLVAFSTIIYDAMLLKQLPLVLPKRVSLLASTSLFSSVPKPTKTGELIQDLQDKLTEFLPKWNSITLTEDLTEDFTKRKERLTSSALLPAADVPAQQSTGFLFSYHFEKFKQKLAAIETAKGHDVLMGELNAIASNVTDNDITKLIAFKTKIDDLYNKIKPAKNDFLSFLRKDSDFAIALKDYMLILDQVLAPYEPAATPRHDL